MGPIPFQVHHSQHAAELLVDAVRRAGSVGLRAEAIHAAHVIQSGLKWYAGELGESRGRLLILGELRWVGVYPLTAIFCVDHARREVWVNRYKFAPRRRRP